MENKRLKTKALVGVLASAVVLSGVTPYLPMGMFDSAKIDTVKAAEDFKVSEEGFKYQETTGGVKIIGYDTSVLDIASIKKAGALKFPTTIDSKDVVEIGDSAFASFVLVNSLGTSFKIYLPSKLKILGAKSFYNNKSAKVLGLPETLEVIGEQAFATELVTLTNIYKGAFHSAPDRIDLVMEATGDLGTIDNLPIVELPKSLKKLGSKAFQGVSFSATNYAYSVVRVNPELKEMGSYVFEGAYLKGIDLSKATLEKLNPLMSKRVTGSTTASTTMNGVYTYLVKNYIPDTLKGELAFGPNVVPDSTVSTLKVPDGVTSLGDNFLGNSSYDTKTEYSLGKNITSIGKNAFSFTNTIQFTTTKPTGLVKLSESTKLENIGDYAFHSKGLQFDGFPDSLKTIGVGALAYSHLPKKIDPIISLKTIGDYAMQGNLTEDTVLNMFVQGKPVTIGQYAFDKANISNELSIPSGKIGEGAFLDNPNITKINLGEYVTSVGAKSFGYATKKETDSRLEKRFIRNRSLAFGQSLWKDVFGSVIVPTFGYTGSTTEQLAFTYGFLPYNDEDLNMSLEYEKELPKNKEVVYGAQSLKVKKSIGNITSITTYIDGKKSNSYNVTITEPGVHKVIVEYGNSDHMDRDVFYFELKDYSTPSKVKDIEAFDIPYGTTKTLDLSDYFSDTSGDTLSYSITGLTSTMYTLTGSTLTLKHDGVGKDFAFNVTASNKYMKSEPISVNYKTLALPKPLWESSNYKYTVTKNEVLSIPLSGLLKEGKEYVTSYTQTLSDSNIAQSWLTPEGVLKFVGNYKNTHILKVKAKNSSGESEYVTIEISVTDVPLVDTGDVDNFDTTIDVPKLIKSFGDLSVNKGDLTKVTLSDYFTNTPNGGAISYVVTSSDNRVVDTWVDSEGTLKLLGLLEDNSKIKVKAVNKGGYSEEGVFNVSVTDKNKTEDNNSGLGTGTGGETPSENEKPDGFDTSIPVPTVKQKITNQVIVQDTLTKFDLDNYFNNLDAKNGVKYEVTTSDNRVLDTWVDSEGTLKVIGKLIDTSKIKVKAVNGGGYSETLEFDVSVVSKNTNTGESTGSDNGNNGGVIEDTLKNLTITQLNKDYAINVKSLFNKLDSSNTNVTVSNLNPTDVTSIYDNSTGVITFQGKQQGFASVTLQGTDKNGNKQNVQFLVYVNPPATADGKTTIPSTTLSISDADVVKNKQLYNVSLDNVFKDTADMSLVDGYNVTLSDISTVTPKGVRMASIDKRVNVLSGKSLLDGVVSDLPINVMIQGENKSTNIKAVVINHQLMLEGVNLGKTKVTIQPKGGNTNISSPVAFTLNVIDETGNNNNGNSGNTGSNGNEGNTGNSGNEGTGENNGNNSNTGGTGNNGGSEYKEPLDYNKWLEMNKDANKELIDMYNKIKDLLEGQITKEDLKNLIDITNKYGDITNQDLTINEIQNILNQINNYGDSFNGIQGSLEDRLEEKKKEQSNSFVEAWKYLSLFLTTKLGGK